MRTTTKVLVAAAVLGVGDLLVFGLRSDPRPPTADASSGRLAAAAVVATSSVPTDDVRTLRDEVPPEVEIDPWLAHPYSFELEVRVIDPIGLPVEGRQLMLAPERMQWNKAEQATDPNGTVVATWRSRQPRGVIVVGDETGTLLRVAVEHGHRRRLTLGSAWQATSPGATRWATLRGDGVPVVTDLPIVGPRLPVPGRTPPMQAGLHPFARFEEPCSHILPTAAPGAIADGVSSPWLRTGGGARLCNIRVTSAPTQFDIEELMRSSLPRNFAVYDAGSADSAPVPQPPPPVGIRGVVYGEDGLPAADIPIAVIGSSPQPLQHTVSDRQGAFAFLQLEPGTFLARAGGGSRGLGIAACEVTQGLTAVTAHLSRDACVRGRVQTPDGQPIAEARIVWRAMDGSWCDETSSAADGSFVLANLPALPGQVSAWRRDKIQLLPNAWAADVRPDAGALVLQYDPEGGSSLQFEAVLPIACAGNSIDVRVWQQDTGLGAIVPDHAPDKPWRIQHLPAGWYQLELFAPGSGWFDAGTHWLDGTTDVDLGRILLPQPGSVLFQSPPPGAPQPTATEVCHLRTDVDVRTNLAPVPFDQPALLPAGDYVLICQLPDGSRRCRRFAARAGETTIVTVPQ